MISKLKFVFLFLAISLFGQVNFSNPLNTFFGTPNLSNTNNDLTDPQDQNQKIITNTDGQYVYAIWKIINPININRVQFCRSIDFGQTWEAPTNLATSIIYNTIYPDVTCDSTGQYVYAIWQRAAGPSFIDIAVSSNYGQSFATIASYSVVTLEPPRITTDTTGKYVYAVWVDAPLPNNYIKVAVSSNNGQNFGVVTVATSTNELSEPKIVSSKNGQHVYVIWKDEISLKSIFSASNDYGASFSAPIDVILNADDDEDPKIATDASGKYVYVIDIVDNANTTVQVAISSDYGVTWSNPQTTPPGTISPYLSVAGRDSIAAQITTSDSGKYVYATWQRENNGTNPIIQVALSSNYGMSWQYPLSTTGTNHLPPNLSIDNVSSGDCHVITDSSGKDVYAVWTSGAPNNIQFASSSDYGASWINPITTSLSTTTPNLSVSGQDAFYPQVTTSSSGNKIYIIWERKNDGTHSIIQTVDGVTQSYIHFPVENVSPIGQ